MQHLQILFLLLPIIRIGVFNLSFTCDLMHIIESSKLVSFALWLLWSYCTFIDTQRYIIVQHAVVTLNFKTCKLCAIG